MFTHAIYTCDFHIELCFLRAYLDWPANVSTKVSYLKTQYSEDNAYVNSVCNIGFRTDWGWQFFLAREPHWTQISSIQASISTIKTYLFEFWETMGF